MRTNLPITLQEQEVRDEMQIVSKTNLEGFITYASPDFIEISGFSEQELLGAPHSIVRHPDMPPAAFQDLWEHLKQGRPWSGIVKNRCKNGDFYWVEANATPLLENGRITGYISVRHKASRAQIEQASSLYELLNNGEQISLHSWKTGISTWWLSIDVAKRFGMAIGGLFILAFFIFSIFLLGVLSTATYSEIRNLILIGGMGILTLLLFSVWSFTRSLTVPLRRANDVFEQIAQGYYKNAIDAERNDEVGHVLQGLKSMQIKLDFEFNHTRRTAEESQRIRTALDNVSTNVVIADRSGIILYANPSLIRTLSQAESQIKKEMPHFNYKKLIGENLDQFHKNPSYQHKILDQLRTTHRATVHIGGREFDLIFNPVMDSNGKHLGNVVEWNDTTALRQVQKKVEGAVRNARAGNISERLDLTGEEGFFQELGNGINHLLETVTAAVGDIDAALMRISHGDLTDAVSNDLQGVFGAIRDNANGTMASLARLVGRIKTAADSIASAAKEISIGHGDLSKRTEQQAAFLEETGNTLERLTSTVHQNAENANQADQMTRGACKVAERGKDLVNAVVQTMEGLQESSSRISEITSVIDGIAFQTNLLALNAAVEAARAGEQGRGFAVVAGEVRSLAARSASAAREIKTLIEDSTSKVQTGSEQVAQAGRTMNQVVSSIQRAATLMTEISGASSEQRKGIEYIHQSIQRMDDGIQQNATLVEEATAAAESMKGLAAQLITEVAVFRLPSTKMSAVLAQNSVRGATAARVLSAPSSVKLPTPKSLEGPLDFTSARAMHLAWREKLRAFLEGKTNLTDEQIGSHRECKLGQWLYGHGLARYKDVPEMKTLEDRHSAMHDSIRKVVILKKGGDVSGAESEYAKLMRLSNELVALLRRLEQMFSAPATKSHVPEKNQLVVPTKNGHPLDEWKEF